MDTNTTPSAKLYAVYVQDTDENENEIKHLGIFPTFKAAVKFRTQWICKNYDMDDPNLEEEWMEDFRAKLGGSPNDAWLDDGHCFFMIEEVPSFV